MENVVRNNQMIKEMIKDQPMNLSEAKVDTEYIIKSIDTSDVELKDFLFTLGCYEGEHITVISNLKGNFVISVKDARYSIDNELAAAIVL